MFTKLIWNSEQRLTQGNPKAGISDWWRCVFEMLNGPKRRMNAVCSEFMRASSENRDQQHQRGSLLWGVNGPTAGCSHTASPEAGGSTEGSEGRINSRVLPVPLDLSSWHFVFVTDMSACTTAVLSPTLVEPLFHLEYRLKGLCNGSHDFSVFSQADPSASKLQSMPW